MSYSVFIHKFERGQPSSAPFHEVSVILEKYGFVDSVGLRLEFTPRGDDLCEIGFIGGNKAEGINSIGFERPVSGGRLGALVFELLAISGMCYFEVDCSYVLARTDVTADLPQGLLEQCVTKRATVISLISEVSL
jgi:hypothetical protein